MLYIGKTGTIMTGRPTEVSVISEFLNPVMAILLQVQVLWML